MSLEATNDTTPSNQIMKNRVIYTTGFTKGGGSAILEWTTENHIKLTEIDKSTEQPTKVLFDCTPNQITSMYDIMTMLCLKIQGVNYQMDMSISPIASAAALSAGGVVGLGVAGKIRDDSGLLQWVDKLRSEGVVYREPPSSKVMKYVLVGIFGLIAVVFLIAFVVGLIARAGR
jgi:hypothetical protein